MTWLLDLLARIAIRTPKLTLAGLLVATLALGAATVNLEVDTGVEGFAPDEGPAATLAAIEERFGTSASVQLLVDAGPRGNVIDHDGLLVAEQLGAALTSDPTVVAGLAPDRTGRSAVVTYGLPFLTAAETIGEELADLDEVTVRLLVDAVLDDAFDDVAPLLADDLEVDPPRARSGLVSIELDVTAPAEVRRDASRAIAAVAAEVDAPGLRIATLSLTAVEDGIERALIRDIPVLLGTSLLLVLLVLLWLFRSFSDVLVGFLGLVGSIVWMAGVAALLGPGGLGWTGPFSQIAIAVPVLLVGLGIDYSVHLTSRYREQRALGDTPDRAARLALATVGLALVLATVASVAGFLANVATPLPPIRDFGIFAAIGIVSAFVILGGAVPATRVLLDRRTDARKAAAGEHAAGRDTTGRAAARVSGPPPRWVRATSALATRYLAPTLGVTALLLLAGVVAASGLSTEFNERDFLPDGDPVVATIDRLDAQFGGDVGERTYVLVDGDPTDAEVVAAVAAVERDLGAIDGVRTVGERPEVTSPLSLIDGLAEGGVAIRGRLATDLETWADPDAAAAELELPGPQELAALAEGTEDGGGSAGAGDVGPELPVDLRAALTARLPAGRSPTAALAATADPATVVEQLRVALAADLATGRPDGLTDAELTALAALPAERLTLATLDDGGFPPGALEPDERDRLATLEALETAGWRDGGTTDGQALQAQLAVVADREPDELARSLDDDGLLLAVSTGGGPDAAERLADELTAAAQPIVARGAQVTVVSDPLVQADIISSLSAAQLFAILISLLAAAVLLVTATLVSSRSVSLGLIGIVPSVVALVLVLGSMRVLGLAFNALTATVASIAVGIGVPYGIHLINRFREARNHGLHADDAIHDTLRNTGAALVGSAVTTGLAFTVLLLSGSAPIRQFGTVSALMIGFALLACLLVQPALLVMWARRRDAVGSGRRPQRVHPTPPPRLEEPLGV
jgi:predicted RND superfamily exporter protein